MKHTAYVVPAHRHEPIYQIEVDDDTAFAEIIFKGEKYSEGYVGMSSMRHAEVQFVYDDFGLYRSDAIYNLNFRMMELCGLLYGVPATDISPLVGTFIVMGLNPYSGETQDVPASVEAWIELQKSHEQENQQKEKEHESA